MPVFVRLLLLLGLFPAVACAQEAGGQSSVRALGNAFSSVYEKVAPSVVVLEVERQEDPAGGNAMVWDLFFQDRDPQMRPEPGQSEGSGFVIREDGYILTNAHVVEDAVEGGIVARLQDGTRLPLTIVGIDDKTDLAVLKADTKGLRAIEWGDSDKVRVGEFVCGIGAPFELDYTLTVGVLSAKGRSNLTSTVYEDYLQTDTAINPGNSGGPLCDLDGGVIGVNTLINGFNRGLSFAIPSKLAREISDELMANGRVVRPWLGIRITTLGEEPDLQEVIGLDQGVLVKTLEPDAPAARSELRPADVIVAVDGAEVKTARDLQQAVLRKGVGQTVDLKVWRRNVKNGDYRQISVVTEELPASPLAASRQLQPPDATVETEAEGEERRDESEWGLELGVLTPDDAKKADVSGGVRIVEVDPGSPGAVAGIEPGDIVTAVGADAVSDPATFSAAMAKVRGDEAAVLMIERKGKMTYAILKR
jgi:S1-C subfamily serine protease